VGALLLTPPTNGSPAFLTREAMRTKFGASGLVGLIFAVLTALYFIFMYAAVSSEVNFGYMAKNQMVAILSAMTFIPAFITLIVCCRGVRGGKKISIVSRIMGGIGLAVSIILLIIPVFMGMSSVSGEKYWEKAVSYDFYCNVGGADFNVKADGTDGEFTYKAEWGIDEDSTCILNVRCDGEATVSNGVLTVECDSYDRYYTMWFDYTSDQDVINFINETRNEFYLLELDPEDAADVESLCSFATVRVSSSSVLCKAIEGRLNVNKVVVDIDGQRVTNVYFDGGYFEAFYYDNNVASTINIYGDNGIIWQKFEFDELGNLTANIYYDSMGNPVQ
jgi:hypothetical protein